MALCIIPTGILAGIWPCGIITMVGELFGAESIMDSGLIVYAFLHTFIIENSDALIDLSKSKNYIPLYTVKLLVDSHEMFSI